MTLKQIKLYRAEWAKARAALRLKGRARNPDTEEYERMIIHEQVTGTRCSSKDLTDEQLDQVLAAFYVLSSPGDLDKQLNQSAQPATRCQYLADDILDRISSLFIALDRPKEAIERGPDRDAYLIYLGKRFSKRNLHGGLAEIDLPTWYSIIACLRIRLDQVQRKTIKPGKQARRHRPYDTPAPRAIDPITTPRPTHRTTSN